MDLSMRFSSLFYGRKLVSVGAPFLLTVLFLLLFDGIAVPLLSGAASLLFLVLCFFQREKKGRLFFLLVALGIALALLIAGIHLLREEKLTTLSGERVLVRGVVTYAGEKEFDVSFVSLSGSTFPLKIRFWAEKVPQVGEKVEGEAVLLSSLPSAAREDGVDLGAKGEWKSIGRNAFYYGVSSLRSHLSSRFSADGAGAFFRAILLGQRSGLSPELTMAFERTASAHLLAISGFHITLLMEIFHTLLGSLFLPRKLRIFLLLVLVFFLLFLTGGSVSVFRAAVMSSFPLASTLFSRRSDSLTSLIFAGVLLVLWEPRAILSLSFLFSFGAVFAILAAAGPLTDQMKETLLEREKGKGKRFLWKIGLRVLSPFAVSSVIFVFIFPLQLLIHGQVLPTAPLYALILIPLFFPCVLAGVVFLVLSLLPFSVPLLSSAALWVARMYLDLMGALSRSAPDSVSFGDWNLVLALSLISLLGFLVAKRAPLSSLFYLHGVLTVLCGIRLFLP